MNPEEIDGRVVLGLSLSTHVGSMGTVVFCHSRSFNRQFFHWCSVPQKLIPFVRHLKEQYHYAPTTPSWSTLVGEYCQILPFFSQDIYDALIAECIICGKHASSATDITQPCDTWKYLLYFLVRPRQCSVPQAWIRKRTVQCINGSDVF